MPTALVRAVPEPGFKVPIVVVNVTTAPDKGTPLLVTVACNSPGAVADTTVEGSCVP